MPQHNRQQGSAQPLSKAAAGTRTTTSCRRAEGYQQSHDAESPRGKVVTTIWKRWKKSPGDGQRATKEREIMLKRNTPANWGASGVFQLVRGVYPASTAAESAMSSCP